MGSCLPVTGINPAYFMNEFEKSKYESRQKANFQDSSKILVSPALSMHSIEIILTSRFSLVSR